uniref:imidazole glycerol phosphate synthase subunit HisH n=1 Tax=Flavobacterium sp. TaxID=239 RepID=UPI00404B2C35
MKLNKVKVAIINYGMGNVASVEKAIKHLGYESIVTNDPIEINTASYIILPGVGAFNQGMENLNKLGLVDLLNKEIILNKKPFLGICLGMQLIATIGFEPLSTKGLGWIEGEVIKINEPEKSIPHLGWNEITTTPNSIIDVFNKKDFYFIHSYHFKVTNRDNIAATVNYGNNYVAVIQKDNIFATQFHPEKSQTSGLELMKSFFNYYA